MNRYVEISPTCLLVISSDGTLLETEDGIFGVKDKKQLSLDEIEDILEKLLSDEITESEDENDVVLLQDIFLLYPEIKNIVLSETEVLAKGFWGEVWDNLKSGGQTKQQREEIKELMEYLDKNKAKFKAFQKASETSKEFQEFIEKHKNELSPEYINTLNQILKVHPDVLKNIHKSLSGKPIIMAVKLADFPLAEIDELAPEDELIKEAESVLSSNGIKKKDHYVSIQLKRINPDEPKPTKYNRVFILRMTIDGLGKFLTKFPKVEHKLKYDV